jgi:hypothetical protein
MALLRMLSQVNQMFTRQQFNEFQDLMQHAISAGYLPGIVAGVTSVLEDSNNILRRVHLLGGSICAVLQRAAAL